MAWPDQYGNLGLIYRMRGELDRAEAMHKKALAIDEKLGRQDGMANEYGNLGLLYQMRGELDRAEAMYKKALAIDEKLGRQEGMADQYGNLGGLYQMRGELDRAEAMHKKALAIDEKLGRQEGMADQYGNLGIASNETRGDLDRAEEMHKKGARDRREARPPGGHGQPVRQPRASSTGSRGELHRAEEMHKKALAINEKLGRQEGMARDVRQPRVPLPDPRRAGPGRGDAQEGAGDRREARPPGGHGHRSTAASGSSTRSAASWTGPRRCTRRRWRSKRSSAAKRNGATSNLGRIYEKRGELDQGRGQMYKKALAIDENLSRQDGIAERLRQPRVPLPEAR